MQIANCVMQDSEAGVADGGMWGRLAVHV